MHAVSSIHHNQFYNVKFRFKLKSYQLTGLNWLIAIHKRGVNGILADEMVRKIFAKYLIEKLISFFVFHTGFR